MIPKTIHLTSRDKNLSEFHESLLQRLIALHPGWEVRLWDDGENDAFVRSEFPAHLDAFRALPFPVMRADLVRYMYMVVHGGWYFDTDYEIHRSVESLSHHRLILPKSREADDKDAYGSGRLWLGNAVFASQPGEPFWTDLLAAFFSKPLPERLGREGIMQTTGPIFLTNVYFSNIEKYAHAYLPERSLFHPDSDLTTPQDLERSGGYGIHRCTGSWLDKSVFGRVKSRISRLLSK